MRFERNEKKNGILMKKELEMRGRLYEYTYIPRDGALTSVNGFEQVVVHLTYSHSQALPTQRCNIQLFLNHFISCSSLTF